MRRSTGHNGGSPSKADANLLSKMKTATETNAQIKANARTMEDKVESARRHLKAHQRRFHEDTSSGESVENKHPSMQRRSRSFNVDKPPTSVLYTAELQHARRMKSTSGTMNNPPARSSPAKSISPARRHESSFNEQTLPDITSSPQRRSTYLVAPQRDSVLSRRGDATFNVSRRSIDPLNESTVSAPHDETMVIAPGLLEQQYRPNSRPHSHGASSSSFHARCAPRDPHPYEVNNAPTWEVEFLPGSLSNGRRVEKDRRSAAVDLLAPNSDSVRYQEERTRREEEELRRLVSEQLNGRSSKEMFDNWVPLEEERRRERGGERREAERKEEKKATRRLWETEAGHSRQGEEGGGEVLLGLDRQQRHQRGEEEGGGEAKRMRRLVEEDENGYAMPLPREGRPPAPPAADYRTPSPLEEEQFYTPATTLPRASRVGGRGGGGEEGVETPILGGSQRRSFLSTTFTKGRASGGGDRLRPDEQADRSIGSTYEPTPDRPAERRELQQMQQMQLQHVLQQPRPSLGEDRTRPDGGYETPLGRRGRREEEEGEVGEEPSFVEHSPSLLDRSRGLRRSMHEFERNLNRSLDRLTSLASHLETQLDASRSNLSSLAAGSPAAGAARAARTEETRRRSEGLDGVAGDRRRGMEASVLSSLPPMREQRSTVGGEELRRMMAEVRDEQHFKRSSLPDERRESPVPRPRSTVPGTAAASAAGLSSLLDANLGRLERAEAYEREAERLAGVLDRLHEADAAAAAATAAATAAPAPAPRSRTPEAAPPTTAAPAAPMMVAIETAGGSNELMEMYEARHRNWHRRGEDTPLRSPRSSISRSPSPLPAALPDPAELRERQTKQGMLDQRAAAVRGTYLRLLQSVYKGRYDRRYEERSAYRGHPMHEQAFKDDQKNLQMAFKREADEAKRRAVDPEIRYRDFMVWLKSESERLEAELEYEMERKEARRRGGGGGGKREERESILSTSRLAEADRRLDERAERARRARETAERISEKREAVRRMEREAREAVALAEIPSSARSSLEGSFALRRYSIGTAEPLRVVSARQADTSKEANKSHNSSTILSTSLMESRKDTVAEMKERLEQRRRQAADVERAMRASEQEMEEGELRAVAARLSAHDEYIREASGLGRMIGESVRARPSAPLPPGVDRLDLSSLDEEEEGKRRESTDESVARSEAIGEIGSTARSGSFSDDSLRSMPKLAQERDSSAQSAATPAAAAAAAADSSESESSKTATTAGSSLLTPRGAEPLSSAAASAAAAASSAHSAAAAVAAADSEESEASKTATRAGSSLWTPSPAQSAAGTKAAAAASFSSSSESKTATRAGSSLYTPHLGGLSTGLSVDSTTSVEKSATGAASAASDASSLTRFVMTFGDSSASSEEASPAHRAAAVAAAAGAAKPRARSSSSSSSASSDGTLTEESPAAKDTVAEKVAEIDEVAVEPEQLQQIDSQFSPLREDYGNEEERDRSLPSTAASTGRQEITVEKGEEEGTVTAAETPEWPKSIVPRVEEEDTVTKENTVGGKTVEVATVPIQRRVEPMDTVTKKEEEVGEKKEDLKPMFSPLQSSSSAESSEEEEGERRRRKGDKRREEEEKKEDGAATSAADTTAESRSPATVVERRPEVLQLQQVVQESQEAAIEKEESENSWGAPEEVLEVGGGGASSGRSAEFDDWGAVEERKEEDTPRREEGKEAMIAEVEKEEEEEKEPEPVAGPSKIRSLRERLQQISMEDEEEEKRGKEARKASISSSSHATSSSSSSTSSSGASTSSSKATTEEGSGSEKSGESTEREERGEEQQESGRETGWAGERAPSAESAASAAGGGASSASGSVDFDLGGEAKAAASAAAAAAATLSTTTTPRQKKITVDADRTPRAERRFRLSLNDLFDSPRDVSGTQRSSSSSTSVSHHGRQAGSPRAAPGTASPSTPRAHSAGSPLMSPDGRKSRFSAVMPPSPRSGGGRRSESPRERPLSHEVSLAMDDSSVADISTLSAVRLPVRGEDVISAGASILSSLPPLVHDVQLQQPSAAAAASEAAATPAALQQQQLEESLAEPEESFYDLMDVTGPKSSISTTLAANESLLQQEEQLSPTSVLPRLPMTMHELHQMMGKREFIMPQIQREVEQIWKVLSTRDHIEVEDAAGWAEMDCEEGEEGNEVVRMRNERIRLIRGVCIEVAAEMHPRDERVMKDGRRLPREIVPLRKTRLKPNKKRLTEAMVKELLPVEGERKRGDPRLQWLGVDQRGKRVEQRYLNSQLYMEEDSIFFSDVYRAEVVEILLDHLTTL